jgi:hypothetical protein
MVTLLFDRSMLLFSVQLQDEDMCVSVFTCLSLIQADLLRVNAANGLSLKALSLPLSEPPSTLVHATVPSLLQGRLQPSRPREGVVVREMCPISVIEERCSAKDR